VAQGRAHAARRAQTARARACDAAAREGAAQPPVPTFAPDAATKAGLRLHFEITTGDTIWPASYKSAVTAYTNAGMTLTKDDTKPGGHCAFDQQAVIQAHIGAMLP